ncbi:sugar ABC transporter ATP-binding protein [Georgenia sp. AZ-5]|uniref:sugar ABC transporter ATP-binding protein n=1 Tax=Georgenia sp. AZ-5 TaxID=3367526 RepID=UPI003754DDF2
MNAAPAVVTVRGLSKRYPGVQALDGVSLEVRAGEVHVLLGENGAGKSTLVKILSGAVQPDDGSIEVMGRPVTLPNPHAAQQAGISTVHQELSLVPDLTVAQNLFLGREITSTGTPLLDRRGMNREAAALLRAVGLDVAPATPVRRLSLAVRQVVEIVRALSREPRVLILDEPTSSLSEQETDELFDRVRQITRQGVGVIYISHRLEELERIADRVTVMRDGRVVGEGLPASTPLPQLVRLMVGRDLAEEFPNRAVELGETLLTVEDLSVPGRVEGATFTLRAGEVVGIFGLVGAGRTELLRGLYGLEPAHGRATLRGRQLVPGGSPRRSLESGLALVPEDRHGWGLVLPLSIRDNVCLSSLDDCSSFGFLSRPSLEALAKRFTAALRVKAPNVKVPVRNLSGGNQQKVVIARALAAGSDVILLDEPTRGVDIGAKIEIYELVARLAADGKGVLVVSSDMPEVIGLSDRILVMSHGRLRAEFPRRQVTQEALLQAALLEDGQIP